jgi:Uma2 family endonuclease
LTVATAVATSIEPDIVMSFQIAPGALKQLRRALGDEGPMIKCFEGSVTLVSPVTTHAMSDSRLGALILAVCATLKIPHMALCSAFYRLPKYARQTGYEPDDSYYIQSHGTAKENKPHDLAIEVVVSHSARHALSIGEVLRVPEMWVWDLPRHKLVFRVLAKRGKHKGTYRPSRRSLAFPFLDSGEVLERLDDPTEDLTTFFENCQAWAAEVLAPRHRADKD